jgi:hypothetical protein
MRPSIDEKVLNNFPDVNLILIDNECSAIGGLCKSAISPFPSIQSGNPSKYKLIFLKERSPNASASDSNIDDKPLVHRKDFVAALNKEDRYIAFRTEDGKYISCRRPMYIPSLGQTSSVQYRDHIGSFEIFKVKFNYSTSSYTFESHNGSELQANQTFWNACCRQSEKDTTGRPLSSWKVSPLIASSAGEEQVEYVAAWNLSPIIASTGEELIEVGGIVKDFSFSAPCSQVQVHHANRILRYVAGKLKEGASTLVNLCHGEGNSFSHYFWRSGGTVFMAITADGFSIEIAGNVIDELEVLHTKYFGEGKGKTDEQLRKYGLERLQTMKRELSYLMAEADEQNCSVYQILLSKCNEVHESMRDNMKKMQEALENLEQCQTAAMDLFEKSKMYKKKTETLKKNNNNLRYATLAGAAAVVAAGLLIGDIEGPAGAIEGIVSALEPSAYTQLGRAALGTLFGGGTMATDAIVETGMWSEFQHIAVSLVEGELFS